MLFAHLAPAHVHVNSAASNADSHVVYIFSALTVAALVSVVLFIFARKALKNHAT